MIVAVFGATGFVGRVVCRHLAAAGHEVHAISRTAPTVSVAGASACFAVGPFEGTPAWAPALVGADVAVYLAARVHQRHEAAGDPLPLYRAINVHAAIAAADAAAAAGVRRFIYLSSIKVNGESTHGSPFTAASPAAPCDAYGVSKWEAEQALGHVGARTGLQVVALRPPMVYGPGARGNVPRLATLARFGARIPLPLGGLNNRRSLLYVEHLADALRRMVECPTPLQPVYLVADTPSVSTPQLLATVGSALHVTPRFVPFPLGVLRRSAMLLGQGETVRRLLDSLEVDAAPLRRDTGWSPSYSFEDAIGSTFAGGADA